MYREEVEGQKIELTYNRYTVAVTFKDGGAVYKRWGDGGFHEEAIKKFAERQGKPLEVISLHAFATLVCDATSANDLFVIYGDLESEKEAAPLFWSNEDGWGGPESAACYTAKEIPPLDLPLGGKWVRMTIKKVPNENAV